MAARIGALAFVVVAIAATAVQLPHHPEPLPTAMEAPATSETSLHDELIRCQSLGAAGAQDNECLRVWSENRRRFLVQGPAAPSSASSTAPQTAAPTARSGVH